MSTKSFEQGTPSSAFTLPTLPPKPQAKPTKTKTEQPPVETQNADAEPQTVDVRETSKAASVPGQKKGSTAAKSQKPRRSKASTSQEAKEESTTSRTLQRILKLTPEDKEWFQQQRDRTGESAGSFLVRLLDEVYDDLPTIIPGLEQVGSRIFGEARPARHHTQSDAVARSDVYYRWESWMFDKFDQEVVHKYGAASRQAVLEAVVHTCRQRDDEKGKRKR